MTMFRTSASLAVVILALALARNVSADAAADKAAAAKAAEASLVADLRLAPLSSDRIALLDSDSEFAFDFFDPAKGAAGQGGKIVLANSANFPAVIGNNIAMAVGFLDACSINTPHTHPRATEMQFSVNGTITTGMITENGARFITTELPPGSMTIFPLGSVHFQANLGCDPLLFVSSFNSEDPGALQIAQRFFGLPPSIVGITLGDLGVEDVIDLEAKIPDNVASGTQECLKKCNIYRGPQPTLQRQPRVSGNALQQQQPGDDSDSTTTPYPYPSAGNGYEYSNPQQQPKYGDDPDSTTTPYPYPSAGHGYEYSYPHGDDNTSIDPASTAAAMAAASAMASKYLGGSGFGGGGFGGIQGMLAADGSSDDGTSGGSKAPSPALIALLAINGTLVLGLLVLLGLWLRRRRSARTRRTLYAEVSRGGDPIFQATDKYQDSGAAGDTAPLTHGLAHGPYYDPHEARSPPHSRPASRLR